MQTVGAVVLAILAFAVDATAQGLTGKDLQQYCGSAVLDYAGGICRGYVEGIIGSARSVDKSGKFKTNADGTWEEHLLGYRWCLSPETATVDELAAVFKKWMAAHPDESQEHAVRLVAEALAEASPCKPAK